MLSWQLPMEITGGYAVGNVFMRGFYASFFGFTGALIIVMFIVLIVKRSLVTYHLATISQFKHLLHLMVKRDFVTRYRRSILGVLWSVLNPLLTMIILTMVFANIFRMDVEHFAIFVFSGQFIYNFFNEATTLAMGSVTAGSGMIKKQYIPKYIFPLSKVLSATVNLAFVFIAFILVFVATRAPLHWTIILIPLPVLYTFVFSLGLGFMLSAASVFFKDVTYLYGVLLTMGFFLTPIMYTPDILSQRMFHLIHLNPLFHYVQYFRDLALHGTIPSLWSNIVCIGFALGALVIGLYVKMSQQDKYILYL